MYEPYECNNCISMFEKLCKNRNISLSLSLFFSSDAKLLEESTALICKNLAINNCKTGNFGALIHNFLIRCTELKASAQCEE